MLRHAVEPSDYPYFDYRRLTFSLGIQAAGQVWLSGSTAARFDPGQKAMVVAGDLLAQAGMIYEKMRKTLTAAGLGLIDIRRIVQYVTPAAAKSLMLLDEFRQSVMAEAVPVVSTIVVDRLLRESALIEIEATASAAADRPAVVVASADGDPAAGDISGQCRQAYAQLERILRSSGADLTSVVKTTEFITPQALANYRQTADVRREVFSPPYPAATGVVVRKLTRPGAQVLVEAVALRAP